MKVAAVDSSRHNVWAMAFDSNGTAHPDAFVVFNDDDDPQKIAIDVEGAESDTFSVARTVLERNVENYKGHDDVTLKNGRFEYTAPGCSVTTFWAK